jgi:ubiquinone/menaquinone biosynthesis C-methylase UbiE
MSELLLGCGNNKKKRLTCNGNTDEWKNVTTLDINKDVCPDVVFDLNLLGSGYKLPFEDNTFDEIHAYHVLEHLGHTGDYKHFFNEFNEYYRVIKPDGLFYILIPVFNRLFFIDPGHSRILIWETFGFLDETQIKEQKRLGSIMTDYGSLRQCNFGVMYAEEIPNLCEFMVILKAIK